MSCLPGRVEVKALQEAERTSKWILGRAGIESGWVEGEDAEDSHRLDQNAVTRGVCGQPLLSSEIEVRLVAAAPPGFAPAALAFALPCAQYGLQITVFMDRVERTVAEGAPSYPTVLGHTLAHELGHVL